MLNFLAKLTFLVPTWLALWFYQQSLLLSPATLALLCSTSSTPDLASKTSVLKFIRVRSVQEPTIPITNNFD